jgi:hypothetical protein
MSGITGSEFSGEADMERLVQQYVGRGEIKVDNDTIPVTYHIEE